MIEFETTAIKNKDNNGEYFSCFGIRPLSANLYGYSSDDIIRVRCVEIEGSSYSNRDKTNSKKIEYWAWEDSNGEIADCLIWYTFIHFNACFTYSIDCEEESGKGRAFRLTVEEI